MPSIPQSLLWISLVVLWLFVLVPMLISKRDTVRRTSDVALATRVLNTGTARDCCAAASRPPATTATRTGVRRTTTSMSTTTRTRRGRRTPRPAGGRGDGRRDGGGRIRVPRRRRRGGGLRRTAARRVRAAGLRPGAGTAAGIRRQHRDVLGRRSAGGRRCRGSRPRTSEGRRRSRSARSTPTDDMTDEFEAVVRGRPGPRLRIRRRLVGRRSRCRTRPPRRGIEVAGTSPELRVEDRRRGERAEVPVPQAGADGHVGTAAAAPRWPPTWCRRRSGGSAARSARSRSSTSATCGVRRASRSGCGVVGRSG